MTEGVTLSLLVIRVLVSLLSLGVQLADQDLTIEVTVVYGGEKHSYAVL